MVLPQMILEESLSLKSVCSDSIAIFEVARIGRGTCVGRLIEAEMVIIANMLAEVILSLESV